MTQPTLQDITRLAREAGAILRDHYETGVSVQYKGVIDLVTEADHKSEAYLIGEVKRMFPTHRIVAEETGELAGQGTDVWHIDPLDGTVNYAHGIPFFCVSIAYMHAGDLKLAAVYDPMRDEMFSAARGQGAWLNERPLRVSNATELQRSLLCTGFPYDMWTSARNNLEYFGKLARTTQGVRRLGSAALDLCYVAAGRLDGFWELLLRSYDVAAGALIAQEAGATVTNVDGDPDFFKAPISVIACAPALHAPLLEALKP